MHSPLRKFAVFAPTNYMYTKRSPFNISYDNINIKTTYKYIIALSVPISEAKSKFKTGGRGRYLDKRGADVAR